MLSIIPVNNLTNNFTFADLEAYVTNHPLRPRVFRGLDRAQVLEKLHRASQAGTMAWYTEDNQLAGVVVAEAILNEAEPPILWVNHMLVSSKKALRWFMCYFLKHFPNYTLMARRHDRVVTYKTNRLCQLILSYKT